MINFLKMRHHECPVVTLDIESHPVFLQFIDWEAAVERWGWRLCSDTCVVVVVGTHQVVKARMVNTLDRCEPGLPPATSHTGAPLWPQFTLRDENIKKYFLTETDRQRQDEKTKVRGGKCGQEVGGPEKLRETTGGKRVRLLWFRDSPAQQCQNKQGKTEAVEMRRQQKVFFL